MDRETGVRENNTQNEENTYIKHNTETEIMRNKNPTKHIGDELRNWRRVSSL